MLFKGILLDCFQRIQQERTVSSAFHLLTGRKAIQTIQDATLYQLTDYLGIFPVLDKQTFQHGIQELIDEGYMLLKEESRLYVTLKGENWLDRNRAALTGFDGSPYAKILETFKQRFLLFIQTLTNTSQNHYQFIPIVDDHEVEQFIKGLYIRFKFCQSKTMEQLYREMESAFSSLTDLEASIFVDRLTSYRSFGNSLQQLSQDYQLSIPDSYLTVQKGFYHLIRLQKENPERYKLLRLLASGLEENQSRLSQSGYQTLHLLKKDFSLEQISRIRNLKQNTIRDHLVEIAMEEKDFPFFKFLDSAIYEEIKRAVEGKKTYRLKEIKNNVDPSISYFQIRLALALYNR